MRLTELMPSVTKLIPCAYRDIQNKIYEQIIEQTLSLAKPAKRPLFVQVSGIPGAGKSTFCANRLSPDKVFISFDAVMEQIPGYRQDVYNLGSAAAFQKWELPARIVGYELLRRAVSRRLNICLEHSGVNDAHVELFENLKKHGFVTEVDFILCRPEIAIRRVAERERQTSRHTPPALITERFASLKNYAARYRAIADKVAFYDTSRDSFAFEALKD